jgi:CRP/FNR family transcriptional regulator
MGSTELEREALLGIFRQGTRLVYDKGEFIIRPGEYPPGVFYIDEGFVRAYHVTKYGEENLLIMRKTHEIFPLIWGVTGQERAVIYQAMSPVRVRRVSQQHFKEQLEHNPGIIPSLLELTIEMYRVHSEHLITLGYRSVRERLISFLLTMAGRFGQLEKGHAITINVPLRHQDIASSINASRETTGRELTALERKGYITQHHSIITLKDMAALRTYL